MKIRIQKTHPAAIVPRYATDGAGCFDLHAVEVSGDHQSVICNTGLAFEIPDGFTMLVFSRSGHGFKRDIRLANCVGVVDSDYRGPVMVKLRKDTAWPESEVHPLLLFRAGDAVAQACIVETPRIEFEVCEQLTLTERGHGGFGSTGA
jgi:dUTP pyrophosphatase